MILSVAFLAQYYAIVKAHIGLVEGLDPGYVMGLQVMPRAAYGTAVIFDEKLVDPVLEFPMVFSTSNESLLLLTESGHEITSSAKLLECDAKLITDLPEFNQDLTDAVEVVYEVIDYRRLGVLESDSNKIAVFEKNTVNLIE